MKQISICFHKKRDIENINHIPFNFTKKNIFHLVTIFTAISKKKKTFQVGSLKYCSVCSAIPPLTPRAIVERIRTGPREPIRRPHSPEVTH